MNTSRTRKAVAALTASLMTAATLGAVLGTAPAAQAADAGSTPAVTQQALPDTVSADALPTVQINGVVWDQVVVGNTVYVGGEFTNARPAGAAPGVNTVPRSNLLAYDIRTGELITSWAPTVEGGKVVDLAVSPDGTKLGIVGNFTKINGVNRYRSAVFNIPSGTLSNVSASLDAPAQAVAMTNTTMYVGGYFSKIGSTARARVGAISLSNGAIQPFTVPVDNNQVMSLALSPDNSQIVLSGNFTSVGGSDNPGYGLYRANATTGAGLPLPVNTEVRNGGTQAAILKVTSDNDSFYGVGYHFGRAGNTEGTFRASWADGSLVNLEDCHGDTYDVAAINGVIYKASHKHYCGNSGGFPQTEPWTFWHSTAWTKDTYGTNTRDIYGYPDHPGTPRPELLEWFPQTDVGTYTGKSQATWSVTGNSQYVVYGGEFPRVNGQPQQGLVRYAAKSIAPNKQGPRPTTTDPWTASVQSFRRGQVKVTWPTVWDYDDLDLTYRVFRQSSGNTVNQQAAVSKQWDVKALSFTDTGLTPGSSTRYYVEASDDDGNTYGTGWVDVTVAATDTITGYGAKVLDDGASKYWPLAEPAGTTTVTDFAGNDNTTSGTGVTRGTPGAMTNSTESGSTFDGTANAPVIGKQLVNNPNVFSQEVWFKTTSTTGGKIAGFGNRASGDSGSYDRHLFMDGAGRVFFGVYPGQIRTLNTAAGYNDGQWHQAVATLGPGGMTLYVDGKRVGSRSDTTYGQDYPGYWRIGGDNTWSGDKYFNGSIDDYSVFPTVLTAAQVNAHYVASGRASTLPSRPTDAYGAAVYDSTPDLFWRLDETSGSTANDAATGASNGTYRGQLTRGQAGVSGTSVRLGNNPWGTVTLGSAVSNPQAFSQEVWINTTTTRGGRIFGFGDSGTDQFSGNYDRMMWMFNDGRIRFGVWSGRENTIDSQAALNDGRWHHVVSTFDSTGMKLYVDGVLQGTNANNVAQSYTGYWKLGADSFWGGSSDAGFGGSVDEASVYSRALTPAEVRSHYRAGGGTPANVAPQAVFTSSVDGLAASFDASGSTDPEGETLTYAWDFGDNTTGTGAKPVHTYTRGGTYTVRLTVTDPGNAVATTSSTVTVQAPNVDPSASFTSTTTDLRVDVDGSGSTDSDGQVVTWAWDFGDGTAAQSGATTSHTYSAGGTYTVTLTVTDDRGGRSTTTRQVTVRPANVAPTASFTSTSTNRTLSVDGSGSSDSDGSVASYAWSWGDNTANGSGRTATHTYAADGTYTVTLTVTDDRGASSTTTRQVTVARVNVAPTASFTASSDELGLSVDGSGSSDPDGTIAAYAWSWGDGTADGSGATASHTYATAGTYTVRLTVTDNDGAPTTTTRQVTVSRANVAPTASFTTSASGLGVQVDGSGSTDPDGSIASYRWSWGDGTADDTGRTASHTYATGGSKTITLTVTDDQGLTGTTTRTVTATAPAQPTVVATDGFDRTATGGWGTAPTGGAWTVTGGNARFSVGGSAGVMAVPAGQGLNADLNAVSSNSSVLTTEFSVDKLVEGQYVAIKGRKVGSNSYDTRLRIAADGSVRMWLLRNNSTVVGSAYNVPFTITPGARYTLKMSVTGTSPTTLSAKVWPSTAQEPTDWQRTATDNTDGFQAAGAVGLFSWLPSAASGSAPVTTQFHSFGVTDR